TVIRFIGLERAVAIPRELWDEAARAAPGLHEGLGFGADLPLGSDQRHRSVRVVEVVAPQHAAVRIRVENLAFTFDGQGSRPLLVAGDVERGDRSDGERFDLHGVRAVNALDVAHVALVVRVERLPGIRGTGLPDGERIAVEV